MKNTFNQKFISHLTFLVLGSSFLYFSSNDEEKISSVLLFAGVYILLTLILLVVKRIFFKKKKERCREISITWDGWKNREDEFKTYGTNFWSLSFNRLCDTIYFIYHWQKLGDTSWVCLILFVRHSFLYNDVRIENCKETRQLA